MEFHSYIKSQPRCPGVWRICSVYRFHIEDVSRSSGGIGSDHNHAMHVCLKLSIGVTQMVLVWKRGVAGGGSEFCKLLRPGNNGREKPRPEQGPALPGTPARAHGSRARRGRWGTLVFTARCAGSRASASALLPGTSSTLHTGTQCPRNSVTPGQRRFASSAWQTFL